MILVVIAVNYLPLLEIFGKTGSSEAFGAFLAFLSLFAGSALGYLTAQVWYLYYYTRGGVYRILHDDTRKLIIDKFGIEDSVECIRPFLTYILLQCDRKQRFRKYLTGRLDQYHIQSTIIITLIMAYILGLGLRVYFHIFVFSSWQISLNSKFWQELLIQISICICTASLLYVSYSLRITTATRYDRIFRGFLNGLKERFTDDDLGELKKAFPRCF